MASEPARRGPRRSRFLTSALVVLIGALITFSCVVGARRLHDSNENRLLNQRVREGAAVAVAASPAVQTPLSSGAVLAAASNGDQAAQFKSLMTPTVGPGQGQPFESVSLWKVATRRRSRWRTSARSRRSWHRSRPTRSERF